MTDININIPEPHPVAPQKPGDQHHADEKKAHAQASHEPAKGGVHPPEHKPATPHAAPAKAQGHAHAHHGMNSLDEDDEKESLEDIVARLEKKVARFHRYKIAFFTLLFINLLTAGGGYIFPLPPTLPVIPKQQLGLWETQDKAEVQRHIQDLQKRMDGIEEREAWYRTIPRQPK